VSLKFRLREGSRKGRKGKHTWHEWLQAQCSGEAGMRLSGTTTNRTDAVGAGPEAGGQMTCARIAARQNIRALSMKCHRCLMFTILPAAYYQICLLIMVKYVHHFLKDSDGDGIADILFASNPVPSTCR
jgi:hypothetical protein